MRALKSVGSVGVSVGVELGALVSEVWGIGSGQWLLAVNGLELDQLSLRWCSILSRVPTPDKATPLERLESHYDQLLELYRGYLRDTKGNNEKAVAMRQLCTRLMAKVEEWKDSATDSAPTDDAAADKIFEFGTQAIRDVFLVTNFRSSTMKDEEVRDLFLQTVSRLDELLRLYDQIKDDEKRRRNLRIHKLRRQLYLLTNELRQYGCDILDPLCKLLADGRSPASDIAKYKGCAALYLFIWEILHKLCVMLGISAEIKSH